MERLARLVDVYTMFAPYTKTLVEENADSGHPVQRPLFMHLSDEKKLMTYSMSIFLEEIC